MVRSWGRVAHMITAVSSHDVRRGPTGAYTRIGACTHPTPRLRVCACTRWWVRLRPQVGAYGVYASGPGEYTQWVHIHICVRVSTQVSAYKFTPDRVNAGIDEP